MDQYSVSCLPTGPDISETYFFRIFNFSDNGYDIKVYLNRLLLTQPVVGEFSGFKTDS